MFWMQQTSLVQCMQLGASVAAAAVLNISLLCAPPPPATAARAVPLPTVTLAAARQAPDLLPEVEPHAIPLSAPEPPPDCALEACLALTFDDGPQAPMTAKLLDILAAENAKATFFMLGMQAAKYPDLVKRVAEEGHEIGNHSWGHANYAKLTPPQIAADFTRAQQVLIAAGAPEPRLFRPPYGARNDGVRQTIPVPLALWNVDPEDWRAPDPSHLAAAVIATAKPGGVIVLHDVKPITVQAAPQFIKELKAKYRLVTMSQLHALTPETPKGEFFGR